MFRRVTVYPKKARNVEGVYVLIMNSQKYKQASLRLNICCYRL